MAKPRVLVIEDNGDTQKFLLTALREDFELICTHSAASGIEIARTQVTDLILMDVSLPGLSGIEAAALLKNDEQTKRIPIIMLSGKTASSDIIEGLSSGGDDYVCKPFDYRELVARIRARLREKLNRERDPKVISESGLKIVVDTHDVFFGGHRIDLTQTEFDILRLLLEKRGQNVSRDEIIQVAWKGQSSRGKSRTIDVHIRAIRKKLPDLSRRIHSIYGVGYKFAV